MDRIVEGAFPTAWPFGFGLDALVAGEEFSPFDEFGIAGDHEARAVA